MSILANACFMPRHVNFVSTWINLKRLYTNDLTRYYFKRPFLARVGTFESPVSCRITRCNVSYGRLNKFQENNTCILLKNEGENEDFRRNLSATETALRECFTCWNGDFCLNSRHKKLFTIRLQDFCRVSELMSQILMHVNRPVRVYIRSLKLPIAFQVFKSAWLKLGQRNISSSSETVRSMHWKGLAPLWTALYINSLIHIGLHTHTQLRCVATGKPT